MMPNMLFVAVTCVLAFAGHATGKSVCRKSGQVPKNLQSNIDYFEMASSGAGNEDALPPQFCTADETSKFVTWTASDPNGVCGSVFMFDEYLGSCCGGRPGDNLRTITVETDFTNPRPIQGVVFELEVTHEERDCCDDCNCWGDPHCLPFGERGRDKIKSFVVCDTSIEKADGQCTNRLDVNEDARARCLGEESAGSDYQYNQGRCVWLPDEGEFDTSNQGGPCVPNGVNEMLMFKRSIGAIESRRRLMGGETDTFEVVTTVGERGVMEQVDIRIKQAGSNSVNSALTLNVKQDCAYIKQLNGKVLAPRGTQTATHAIFQSDEFRISRTLTVQRNAMDLSWGITERVTGDTISLNCKGSTDFDDPRESDDGGSQENFRAYLARLSEQDVEDLGFSSIEELTDMYGAMGISTTGGEDRVTTRSDKGTIIDSKFFISKAQDPNARRRRLQTDEDDGFCFSGMFAEYSAEDWYGPGNTSPFEQCQFRNNLDFNDREAISQLDDCQRILKKNKCNSYKDAEGTPSNKDADKRYKENLDTCIRNYCALAFLPAGTSPMECYTDFYDFGAASTIALYPPSTEDDPPQNPSAVPVVQEECEEYISITYKTEDYEGTQFWTEGDSPFISFPVEGNPVSIVLEQFSCAAVCGTRPKIDLKATFETVCELLDEKEYTCVETSELCEKFAEECV